MFIREQEKDTKKNEHNHFLPDQTWLKIRNDYVHFFVLGYLYGIGKNVRIYWLFIGIGVFGELSGTGLKCRFSSDFRRFLLRMCVHIFENV